MLRKFNSQQFPIFFMLSGPFINLNRPFCNKLWWSNYKPFTWKWTSTEFYCHHKVFRFSKNCLPFSRVWKKIVAQKVGKENPIKANFYCFSHKIKIFIICDTRKIHNILEKSSQGQGKVSTVQIIRYVWAAFKRLSFTSTQGLDFFKSFCVLWNKFNWQINNVTAPNKKIL
jgi:hypothetical protein